MQRAPGKSVRLTPAELAQLAALETRWHCGSSTVLRRALHEAYERETTKRGRK
jgi:hypothetical protein